MVRSVDSGVVLAKVARLGEALAQLAELAAMPFDRFAASWALVAAAERNLEVAVQACVDVGNHLIARRGLVAPSAAVEVFRVLADDGLLSEDLADELVALVRLRNRLAHEYERVVPRELWTAARQLDPFRRFAQAVGPLASPPGSSHARERAPKYRKSRRPSPRSGK
ncbi:MAG: DUF86 domain-containing protein [Deltaproteobacteria bacterium]|nr:DUF86 domain-containing protein [Deltaproteobacteria bacterium]